MKTLKQIIAEVAQPRGGDELEFVDKHEIEFIDHPESEEGQHTSSKPKAKGRIADYVDGEDEDVYEAAQPEWQVDVKGAGRASVKAANRTQAISRALSQLRISKDNKSAYISGIRKKDVVVKQLGEETVAEAYRVVAKDLVDNSVFKSREIDSASEAKQFADRMKKAKFRDGAPMYSDVKVIKEQAEQISESISKMSDARLKFHATKKFPHGRYSSAEIKDEHNRRMKSVPNYQNVVPSMNEDLTENFKVGALKLKDGTSVTVKAQEAEMLNDLFGDLNPENKKKMLDVATSSKKGFNEILGFAKEAM